MASSINASTSGGGGVIVTSDATGNLNIQSGGSTVVAVTSTGATVTGTLAATGSITGSSTVAGSTGILYPLTSGTAVASTSGTSIDFTGIPSWVKRITVMFNGVSTNGTSDILIQIGAGSVTTSGYTGTASSAVLSGVTVAGNNYTSGYGIRNGGSSGAAIVRQGLCTICLVGSNVWTESGIFSHSNEVGMNWTAGNVTLGGTLDRVRITTSNGTDTFDAGSINILYE